MANLSKEDRRKLLEKHTPQFGMLSSSNFNKAAVEKVKQWLPEINEKSRFFGSNNSQTTISLMSLTMMNGQSPYRLLRQILAEIERRKIALNENQINYVRNKNLLKKLQEKENKTELDMAKLRCATTTFDITEQKLNGAFKDIAILIDQYENIKKHQGIEDWDEEAFEREEKLFHVRRGFELMYRNLVESGSAHTATIEYNQQYGIHPQVCLMEVMGYVKYAQERIEKGDRLHSNDLEEFLDEMAVKYLSNVDLTCERIFGTKNIHNYAYMYKNMQNSAR
tara:strand:+ start:668 stop:1507 length:840 start_codon:yes stop_codon:yes gene_type:complete